MQSILMLVQRAACFVPRIEHQGRSHRGYRDKIDFWSIDRTSSDSRIIARIGECSANEPQYFVQRQKQTPCFDSRLLRRTRTDSLSLAPDAETTNPINNPNDSVRTPCWSLVGFPSPLTTSTAVAVLPLFFRCFTTINFRD